MQRKLSNPDNDHDDEPPCKQTKRGDNQDTTAHLIVTKQWQFLFAKLM